jgi:hypothetical protein
MYVNITELLNSLGEYSEHDLTLTIKDGNVLEKIDVREIPHIFFLEGRDKAYIQVKSIDEMQDVVEDIVYHVGRKFQDVHKTNNEYSFILSCIRRKRSS